MKKLKWVGRVGFGYGDGGAASGSARGGEEGAAETAPSPSQAVLEQ